MFALTMGCARCPGGRTAGARARRKEGERESISMIENIGRTNPIVELLSPQATSPSGFSHSSLNAFISAAPSAPSIARWSKLPVALITVAICKASSTT